MKLMLLTLLVLLGAGCANQKSKSGKSVIILGIGYVKFSDENEAASVTKMKAFGITSGTLGGNNLSLGYKSASVINVKTNSNVLVEVR